MNPALPQNEDTSQCVLPPGEFDRRYRQDFFCLWQPHRAMSTFAELLWPLLLKV